MLVLPVSAADRKKFPLATFLIILTNCLVFFGLQGSESTDYDRAFTYYHASGLARIEYAAYVDYRTAKGGEKRVSLDDLQDDVEWSVKTYFLLIEERGFQEELRSGKLIADPAAFGQWREKRQGFDQRLAKVFSQRYGYSPLRKNTIGLFTCMFLHGGVMHLAGNMIFLWFVGSLLEIGVGWRRYLPGYLVTGVCASLLFGIVYPTEHGPLVGASGAIAGLMGAYGLIYGRARIKVFYSLGFYFDYAKIPGWVLFPFWLGNEFYQLHSDTTSNVAYMAHIGGLLAGACLGLVQLRLAGDQASAQLAEEERRERVPLLLEEGLAYFSELKLKEARAKIVEALEVAPTNLRAMVHLFTIDKCSPESEEFHRTAGQLLGALATGSEEELCTYFEEYRRVSGKPRLSPDVTAAMVQVYGRRGRLADAARLLSALLRQVPNHLKVPGCLWQLGQAYHAAGNREEGRKCLLLLANGYPTTAAGRRAAEMLGEVQKR